MKKDSRIVRRNRRFLYRMLSAGGRVATKDDNTLRHVTAIGRVHFYKQLVDDDAFGDSQPTQKHIVHRQLLKCIKSYCNHSSEHPVALFLEVRPKTYIQIF